RRGCELDLLRSAVLHRRAPQHQRGRDHQLLSRIWGRGPGAHVGAVARSRANGEAIGIWETMMNRYIRSTGTRAAVRGLVFVVTAGVLAAAARDVAAQETYRGYPVQRVDFVSAGGDPNTPDLDLRARRSPFRLRAMNDVAFSGMRMAGTFN